MTLSVILILTIIVTASLLSSTTSLSYGATNSIPSPREQMDSGISPTNIKCNEGLKPVIRASTNSAACVKNISYEKIIQTGWAKSLVEFKNKPQPTNIGEVKTIKTVPLYFNTGIRESSPEIVTTYNYIFEACAKSNMIRSPEVLIITDSETKTVILSKSIPAMSCQLSTTVVKATDVNSIKASLVKKTDLSIMISELESKVINLKETLAKEKKELGEIVKKDPTPNDFTKLVSEKTEKITTLRNELNSARADLQKSQYVLIVNPSVPSSVENKKMNKEIISIELPPKNYAHVNKIKIVPQFVDAGRLKSDPVASAYNFIFEACSGKNNIVYPEVMVISDSEVKSLKLSESLDIHTCQTSSTIIKAGNPDSIYGTMISTGDISKMLSDLEIKVTSLQDSISKDKKSLSILVNQNPQPDDFTKKVSELTEKITSQRNELNKIKHELISIKYMVNE
ncbi:MAG: hypothetical protein E4G77_04665 [Nitrosopumilus sp.]|nr:MAG: hypothetical protein E4G77_04665 [Nitrosopumilus sp.]